MFAHGQYADFGKRNVGCTVKMNTEKRNTAKRTHCQFEYKNVKTEKIKGERTHKDNCDTLKKTRASVAEALIKAQADHAALLVKASFMEKQYALEAKQGVIKRRLEELELETQIAKVKAKLSVLNTSKKLKASKSSSAPEKVNSNPQSSDSRPCSSARCVQVFVGDGTEADDTFDELDWEGPAIYVPIVVSCEQTGAGDAAEMQPVLSVSPDCPVPVAPEPQQEVEVPDSDKGDSTLTTLDIERGSHVDQLPVEVVAAGSQDEEPVKTTVSVPVEEDIHGAVPKRLQQELVSSGLFTNMLPTSVYVTKKDSTAVVLPPQVLGELMQLNGVLMNFGKSTVALMICVLILLVGRAHKLFKMKRYKAFKRKRWKLICF